MIYTDDKAKTRWCPFARYSDLGSGNRRRSGEPLGSTFCIASDCMAWRWAE
ncbi:hypothetical protein LCGC14_1483120, partial [marine sediment metagenome]